MSVLSAELSPTLVAHRCKACGLGLLCGPRPPSICPCCRILSTFETVPTCQVVSVPSSAPNRYGHHAAASPFGGGFPSDRGRNWGSGRGTNLLPRGRVVDPANIVERVPYVRSSTGVAGLDHVLGGGLATGYVVMIAGPPGAHKSTICTQAASSIQELGTHFGDGVAYGSAEEDDEAVIETAQRVAKANFKIALSTSVQEMIRSLDSTGAVVWVVDSLMAITSDDLKNEPGSPSQVSACATLLYQRAHATGPYKGRSKRSILIIAHGTKAGDLAGPMKALHAVDGCLLMEHVDPIGDASAKRAPWSVAPDQTRPTGFVSARVYRKMRKASNKRVSYFSVQPEYLDNELTELNPVGGRLDRVEGPTPAAHQVKVRDEELNQSR